MAIANSIKPYLSFFPVFFSLMLLFVNIEMALSALLIIILLLWVLLIDRNPSVKRIVAISFIIRVAIALFEHYGALTSYGWDDYFTIAIQIKKNIQNGYPLFANINESIHGISYGVVCAYVYCLFGEHQIIMQILNCFLGAILADRVFNICFRLTSDEQSSIIASFITAFFPSFMMFCALDMRDAIIFYLTAEMLFRISEIMAGSGLKNVWMLLFEIIALYFLRTQYLILFTLIFLVYFFIRSNFYKKLSLRILVISILSTLVWLGYKELQEYGFFPVLFRSVNADMAWRAAGGSAYLSGVSYETWWDVLRWTPIRLLHFAFGPFPWTINNLFMMLAGIESFILVLLTLAAFSKKARLLYYKNQQLYLFLLLFAVMGLFSSAVIDSNYGTAIRHKMNFVFIFFILAAASINSIRLRIV
jgi:hypothetical protein